MGYEDFIEGKPDDEKEPNVVSPFIYNIKKVKFQFLCDKASVAGSSMNKKRESNFNDAWNYLPKKFDLAQGSDAGLYYLFSLK